MKIIVLRDTVFHLPGKPVIVCKASPTTQYAPDWVTDVPAYQLGLSCGNITTTTKRQVIVAAVAVPAVEVPVEEVTADVEEAQEDPAPKKSTGK